MRATHSVVPAIFCIVVMAMIGGSARSQEKSPSPNFEYKAVALGADERQATRKLNELAAQGWEYVGPLGNALVAFKRAGTASPGVAAKSKTTEVDLASRVSKLGGQVKRATWVKDRVVWIVDLQGTQTGDADLAGLGPMADVDDLDLSFTRVTDKGVRALAGNTALRRVSLTGTKVSDAAIEDLRQIPNLQHINLAATAVTARGIAQLVEDKSCDVCPVALGDKARFRVFQEFSLGKLQYSYLMINDTYYGRFYPGKYAEPNGEPEDRRRLATTYYHRHGPVGAVMSKLEYVRPAGLLDYPADARLPAALVGLLAAPVALPSSALVGVWSEPAIAVVRLNVGTHAAYGRPFQHIHFYNSTPELKEFSLPKKGQPVYFGFIQDAQKRGCQINFVDGPERASLAAKAPKRFYSAMFIDITRNDLRDINTDLLTNDAMADMMAAMTETGVLCFHTSHRYHDMVPPIVDAAASLNLSWKVGKDSQYDGGRLGHFSSEWVMIARKAAYLKHLSNIATKEQQIDWTTPQSSGLYVWRDGQPHDLQPLARQE
jgi:hypothetical protein